MEYIQSPSPNHDERKLPVSLLLLHYTGMKTGAEALERLTVVESKVSAHYLVEEEGRVFQMVDESRRAWHGGVGYWRGITDINSASIGIEVVNPGHEWGYRAFPKAQMEAVTQLCQRILSRHQILPRDVIGHSDIAPIRKEDPGELFDWRGLAAQGVGLYPSLRGVEGDAAIQNVASTTGLPRYARNDVMGQLQEYGYSIENLEKTITAFQRHFRPALLSGEWDEQCAEILASLLKSA